MKCNVNLQVNSINITKYLQVNSVNITIYLSIHLAPFPHLNQRFNKNSYTYCTTSLEKG